MFTYTEFLSQYNIPGIKSLLSSFDTQITLPELFVGNSYPFLSVKTTNNCIGELIQRGTISKPAWEKTWLLPKNFCVSNKVREVAWKILRRRYPANSVIVKYMPNVDPMCSFCHHTEEMMTHLFWDCTFNHTFRNYYNLLLNRKLGTQLKLKIEFILFGIFDEVPVKKMTGT